MALRCGACPDAFEERFAVLTKIIIIVQTMVLKAEIEHGLFVKNITQTNLHRYSVLSTISYNKK